MAHGAHAHGAWRIMKDSQLFAFWPCMRSGHACVLAYVRARAWLLLIAILLLFPGKMDVTEQGRLTGTRHQGEIARDAQLTPVG